MSNKNYYDILGVSKTAEYIDIKRAYKRLAIKYHPDRNRGNKIFEEKFKEIKEAYEILSDKKKRAMYDQYGHSAFKENVGYNDYTDFNSSSDFSDVFGDIFGDIFNSEKKKSSSKGSDILYNLELNLEEVIKGVSKEFKVNLIQKCSVCYGSGCKPGTQRKLCNVCKGKGNLKTRQGFFTIQQTCPNCNGSGYVIGDFCYLCKGSGTERTLKSIFIRIPAGINDNDRIRLSGKGNYDGDIPGDLYIKIRVKKHPIFTREKNNLYCEVPINFSLAALGGEINVPTLDGYIKLYIPSETQTGKLFRIKNKGIRFIKSNNYGDLLCKILVETPVNLNKYQKKLLYKLSLTLSDNKNINNPKTKSFFDGVKKFFNNLTN